MSVFTFDKFGLWQKFKMPCNFPLKWGTWGGVKKFEIADVGEGGVFKLLMGADVGGGGVKI